MLDRLARNALNHNTFHDENGRRNASYFPMETGGSPCFLIVMHT